MEIQVLSREKSSCFKGQENKVFLWATAINEGLRMQPWLGLGVSEGKKGQQKDITTGEDRIIKEMEGKNPSEISR